MKKILLFSALVLVFNMLFASDSEVEISSKIKEVTVFQKGAQVYRTGSVFVNSGVTDLLIMDLPRNINQQSLQVKGFGNFTILSVNYRLNYLISQKQSKEIT